MVDGRCRQNGPTIVILDVRKMNGISAENPAQFVECTTGRGNDHPSSGAQGAMPLTLAPNSFSTWGLLGPSFDRHPSVGGTLPSRSQEPN
jgi:hypothetical protein